MRHYQSATETLVKVRASLAISIGLSPLIERSAGDKESLMANIDAHVVKFQCPSCGHDLEQSIGRLKSSEHMQCPGCGIGINIDTNRLANAAEEMAQGT